MINMVMYLSIAPEMCFIYVLKLAKGSRQVLKNEYFDKSLAYWAAFAVAKSVAIVKKQ